MQRPQKLKRLTTLAVLLSLCMALVVSNNTPVRASGSLLTTNYDKVSPDIRRLIQSGHGGDQIKEIVQETSKSSSRGRLVGGVVRLPGGVVVGVFSPLKNPHPGIQ